MWACPTNIATATVATMPTMPTNAINRKKRSKGSMNDPSGSSHLSDPRFPWEHLARAGVDSSIPGRAQHSIRGDDLCVGGWRPRCDGNCIRGRSCAGTISIRRSLGGGSQSPASKRDPVRPRLPPVGGAVLVSLRKNRCGCLMFKAFEFCLPTNATKWLHGFRIRLGHDGNCSSVAKL